MNGSASGPYLVSELIYTVSTSTSFGPHGWDWEWRSGPQVPEFLFTFSVSPAVEMKLM